MTARVRRPLQKSNQWQLPRANGLERSTIAMFYSRDGRGGGAGFINNYGTTIPVINNAGFVVICS